jgi:hypothetical protein
LVSPPTASPDEILRAAAAKILEQDQRIKTLEDRRIKRTMNEAEKQRIRSALSEIAQHFPPFPVDAPPDGEAQEYAKLFVEVFTSAGLTANGPHFVFPSSAGSVGIMIVVNDLNHVPPAAEILAEALVKAGVPIKGAVMPMGAEEFHFVVGSKP